MNEYVTNFHIHHLLPKDIPMNQIFSSEDIQHFQEHGYVRLVNSFPLDTTRRALEFVWDLLERHYSYDRHSPQSVLQREHHGNRN